MKILNLYAGIGGNRKLWDGHEVTAIENDPNTYGAYHKLYPDDIIIPTDAHEFLLTQHAHYDFIWSSPPCPTHSKMSTALKGWGIVRYPDMALYQEILFLRHFYKGKWVVENVASYYEPLIQPQVIDRHYFWSNFYIPFTRIPRKGSVTLNTKEANAAILDIELPEGTKNQRKLLRNAVNPILGQHILQAALAETKQAKLGLEQ